MGQINLYRIDGHKKTEFVNQLDDKFEFLGDQNYQRIADGNECTYTVLTYVGKKEERKLPEWKWVLDEYEYPIPETLEALRAILVIERDGMC